MLRPNRKASSRTVTGTPNGIAVVASEYNRRYVDSMLRAALRVLRGGKPSRLEVFRVPGAFEIPVVASRLAALPGRPFGAVVCLGLIVRGETVHADYIGRAVTGALMDIQVRTGVAMVHEVLLVESLDQARARCLGVKHNRGIEAAQTALHMAGLLARLPTE